MFAANHTNEHETATTGTSLINKVVGSGLYFAIAWVCVNYITHGISAFFAWNRGYTPNFTLNGLSSLTGTTGWCGRFIAEVFASAPISALLISIATWLLFSFINPLRTHLRTFVLWTSIAAFIVYYGHVLAGIAYMATGISKLFMGFVAMYTWARWETETIIIVLILQAIISLVWPLLLVPHLCKLSPSRMLFEDKRQKSKLFYNTFFLPILLGCGFMLLATFPYNPFYIVLQLVACFIITAICFAGMQRFEPAELNIVKGGLAKRPTIYYIALAAALVAVSRFVLTIPVYSFL
jgi:hypothetical protein